MKKIALIGLFAIVGTISQIQTAKAACETAVGDDTVVSSQPDDNTTAKKEGDNETFRAPK